MIPIHMALHYNYYDTRQDSKYQTGNFTVLDVDLDCVRLSKFIERKINCQYEDGKAFYEVTENEEDLLYYKKILRSPRHKVCSMPALALIIRLNRISFTTRRLYIQTLMKYIFI